MPPKFGGGIKCKVCEKTVYANELTSFDGGSYHNECFKCSICGKLMQVAGAGSMEGKVSHKKCFKEQFKETGGKYGGVKVTKVADRGEAEAQAAADAAKPKQVIKEELAPVKAEGKEEEAKAEPKKAEPKKAEPKKEADKEPAAKEPKITESAQKDKCFIENYDNSKNPSAGPINYKCELIEEKPACGVFIGNCKKATIVITGKAKNVVISGCTECNFSIENCVTTIEIVNCKKCAVQAQEACGTFTIDKSDRTSVYVADASAKDGAECLVYSSASTSSNVYFSTADGEDQVEYAIPERFISNIHIGDTPTTKVDDESLAPA